MPNLALIRVIDYSLPEDRLFYNPKYKRHDRIRYFVRVGDKVKIGSTRCLQSRLIDIQTDNAEVVELLCVALQTERELHELFQEHRYRAEWFNDCEDIRDWITQNGYEVLPVEYENGAALPVQRIGRDMTSLQKSE